MEKILQAFSDIGDVLPRLDRLKVTFPEDTNFNQVVALIYSDIIEFHQRAYKFFRRKAWHVWFAFDWGLFERRFKLILQKLAIHCDLLDKEAAAAHFSEMKQYRDKRQLEEDAFEQQRQCQMAQDVFRWLSAAEDQQEERLHRISDHRQPETCNWILEDPQMRSWIEDDSGDEVLWMTGIPGAGKSFLCSMIVENLQTQQHLSTLYYFCGHQSSSGDTCAITLRTLAVQLLQQNLDMASLVHQAYLQKGSNRSGPAMKRLLTQVLPTSKIARIVIDGIDEGDYATQQEILKSLGEIRKSAPHHCKLLVSSRDEPQIQKSLASKSHLKLGEKTVEGLSLYIKDKIKNIQIKFPEIDSALLDLAEQRLHGKGKGMFLWVRLVTDMLVYQISELEIRHAIDQLPDGLDEAYGLIQSRINSLRPQLRQRAFKILYWLCAARRPISLHEVADGIVLHPGQTTLNKKTRSSNIDSDIIELCAPLLERLNNDVLDLVHFSAKEYFVHEQSGPFIDVAKAHLNIAFSCVINLTSCLDLVPRNTGGMSKEDLESRVVQGYYGLQAYGQEFWAEHVLAYLGEVGDRGTDARELIAALEAFSQVWKHRTHAEISLPSALYTAEASSGLNSLRNFPNLRRFISGWLHFKFEFNKMRPSLNTLDAQEEWRLGSDETFLSLIDSRLCAITERLLMMESSQLPLYIDKDDLKRFVSRFNFPCRFQGCIQHYDTLQERDSHEVSHVLSFPCLQCDFSGRGFRSPKDLEKHVNKYHMSPEDFEIPDNLHVMGGFLGGSLNSTPGAFPIPPSRSGRWTERGRRALQQGFQHVLGRLELQMEAARSDANEPGSSNANSVTGVGRRLSQHTSESTMTMSLDSIRQNVEKHKYESLTDFKNDLTVLYDNPETALKLVGDERVESICDDELEIAMSAFPAFANFDHTASKKVKIAALLSSSTDQVQGHVEGLNGQVNDLASPNTISFGTRVPYWSLPEQKQFPELLQRCGRDFSKIADHLKTKTPEEVDQHFVYLLSMGNNELSDAADLADARLRREAGSIGPSMELRDAESEMQASNDLADENLSISLSSSQPASADLYPGWFADPMSIQGPMKDTTKLTETNMDSSVSIHGPISKKRRPPPRALCPHCSVNKDGLRDEYALEKHIERFHKATRKVWICEDISIDKRFLTNCRSCSLSKRYSSKNSAGKHLRKEHFNAETSAETLQRWTREIEERNLSFQPSSAHNTVPMTRPVDKRQKTRGTTISLPRVKCHPDGPRTLPSMMFEDNTRKSSKSASSPRSPSSLDDDLDEDDEVGASLSTLEAGSSTYDIILEDVSFDNFLPGGASEIRSTNIDDPPHRRNQALIRPDQVPRLPNLDFFRKSACLDQVEALYHKLDNASVGSPHYKEALENLISISRLLMKNLRDWRRKSTLAMNIPFSI